MLLRLLELLKILEEKYKKTGEKLHDTASINEIEKFAEQIKELAEEYHFHPLIEWGEKLLTQAVAFKIEAIPQTLKEFPGQLEKVKSALA